MVSAFRAGQGTAAAKGIAIGRRTLLSDRRRRRMRGPVGFSGARLTLVSLVAALLTALPGTFATAASAAPNTAYVANAISNSVTPIDLATNEPGAEIKVGKLPVAIAIIPDGRTAYIANE